MTSKVVPILKNSIGPVEDGIPIPKHDHGLTKYPFNRMSVGQSFTVPIEIRKNVASAAWSHSNRYPPMKFKMRVEGERVRVWRIK